MTPTDRQKSVPVPPPVERSDWFRLAMQIEKNGWVSLALWLRRRSALTGEEMPYPYRGPLLAPMWVMTILSALEVVALDVLIPWTPGWTWLRVTLVVIGVWGVVFVLGMLAGVTVHPHALGPAGLRIRHGATLEIAIPWDRVRSVRHEQRSWEGRSVDVDGPSLRIAVSKQTNVHLRLDEPVEALLVREGRRMVSEIAFHTDDVRGIVKAIRQRMGG